MGEAFEKIGAVEQQASFAAQRHRAAWEHSTYG